MSGVQATMSSFVFWVSLLALGIFSAANFLTCYSNNSLQKSKRFEICILNLLDQISITFMYAVAASPLAKQTGTGGGAGEMNAEHRQKQVRLTVA